MVVVSNNDIKYWSINKSIDLSIDLRCKTVWSLIVYSLLEEIFLWFYFWVMEIGTSCFHMTGHQSARSNRQYFLFIDSL